MHAAEDVARAHLLTYAYAVNPHRAACSVVDVVLVVEGNGKVVVAVCVEDELIFAHPVCDDSLLPFHVALLVVGVDACHAYHCGVRAHVVVHGFYSHRYFSGSRSRLSHVDGRVKHGVDTHY